jgi:2Fe-2S ferredoxin
MPKITFLPNRRMSEALTVEVPDGTSILDAAEEHVPQIPVGSACGGVCACSTCHVYVQQGAEHLSEQQDDEIDRLDLAFDPRPESRLGCQTRVQGGDVVVKISEESLDTFENEHPEHR